MTGNETLFVVLGAQDIEMSEIEKLLEGNSLVVGFGFAAADGKRCHPGNAYKSTNVINSDGQEVEVPATATLVFVECDVTSLRTAGREIKIADHHRPGDPGFGRIPQDSIEASSIGQVAKMLGVELTHQQEIIAAADHNLLAAYHGLVRGVTAMEVLAVRATELAARNRTTPEEVRLGVLGTVGKLWDAPEIRIGSSLTLVHDVRDLGVLPYAVEAGTMHGIAFIGRVDTRDPNKVFLSGPDDVIAYFLANPSEFGVTNAYGDPARNFAGGMQA